jgi:hypothetical protein
VSAPGQRLAVTLAAAATLTAAGARADELKLDWSGRIQSDLRLRVEDKGVGAFYNRIELPAGVERNQNILNLKLKSTYGAFSGVASVDLLLDGYTGKLPGLGSLSNYNAVQPVSIEPQALYLEGKDLLVHGLDLRVGQQIVSWGVGDQFNPTNNLNADDLRDPLLFGRQQANFMVKLDYWVTKSLSLSGVLVPIFKPALLPRSAALGIAAIDRLPFTDAAARHRIEAENAFSAGSFIGSPAVVASAIPTAPGPALNNMQVAYRIAGTIAEQDIALSYYNGRTDFPVPVRNHTRLVKAPQCDPADLTHCIQGNLATDVTLAYPRMHVYGLNVAGEVNPLSFISSKLHGIGYRLEGALVVPEPTSIRLENEALDLAFPQPAGEYAYNGGKPPVVVFGTPFLKWVIGLDYSFGEHVYANAQWVHGLADEFGAGDFIHPGYVVRKSDVTTSDADTLSQCVLPRDGSRCAREILHPRLGDYVVVGVDIRFLDDAALLRLFAILDVSGVVEAQWSDEAGARVETRRSPWSPEGFSAVIFPELDYNFGNGLELGVGALLELGRDSTKFGDPAAGGSVVWTRGRYSF